MEIVVNHVTRMSRAPEICIAGIDAEAFEHVRPMSATAPLTRTLLRDQGGPVGMGSLVDVGPVVPRPSPPEVEDHAFDIVRMRHVADLDGDTFLQMLEAVSEPDLLSAFGPVLERVGRTYAIEPACGDRSLATGSLDTQRSREVLELLRELCRERQVAVVLVSHDPLAAAYADRVFALRDGVLCDYRPDQPAAPAA